MPKRIALFIFAFFFVKYAVSMSGFVTDVLVDKKHECLSTASKKIYSVTSEMQCTHRCLQHDKCELINYNTARDAKENCEISTKLAMNGWKAITFQRQRILNDDNRNKSCNDIYNRNQSLATGVYELESGKHFCWMEKTNGSCGKGGWTLALKVDGTKRNFVASSPLWTNNEVFNVENGLDSFYESEAKFPAFNNLTFDDVCIGMKVGADVRWLKIPGVNKESLVSIFKSGNELLTTAGRSAWKGLIASSSLQLNCNREGFNVKGGSHIVRIGFIANEYNYCSGWDSFIGIGSADIFSISCGNIAQYGTDNGNRFTSAFGFVLIK